MSIIRGVIIILVFLIITLILIVVQFASLIIGRWQEYIPHYYHKFIAKLIGLDIVRYGSYSSLRPLLIVSNHSSWLDIIVISSIVRVCFVAKKEVSSWPFFGLLAKLQRTVFIERSKSKAGIQRDMMLKRLQSGQRLSLFPEGTSSDGKHVLPFKSSLFSLAEMQPSGNHLSVQPVSIAYTGLDGLPIGIEQRSILTWYGDVGLLSHIWGVLSAGPSRAEIIFHDPVSLEKFNSRKEMAVYCQKIVANGVSDANAGRLI